MEILDTIPNPKEKYYAYHVLKQMFNFLAENYGSCDIAFSMSKTGVIKVEFDLYDPTTFTKKACTMDITANLKLAKFKPSIPDARLQAQRPVNDPNIKEVKQQKFM